jgi:hypothetical protein
MPLTLNQLVSPFSESDKMPWGGAPKCPACDRNVYPMDQVIAADRQDLYTHIQPTLPNQTFNQFSRVYQILTMLRSKFCDLEKKVSFYSLKVDGNEKLGGLRFLQLLGIGLGPWRSMSIFILNMPIANAKRISVSAHSNKMNRRLVCN